MRAVLLVDGRDVPATIAVSGPFAPATDDRRVVTISPGVTIAIAKTEVANVSRVDHDQDEESSVSVRRVSRVRFSVSGRDRVWETLRTVSCRVGGGARSGTIANPLPPLTAVVRGTHLRSEALLGEL